MAFRTNETALALYIIRATKCPFQALAKDRRGRAFFVLEIEEGAAVLLRSEFLSSDFQRWEADKRWLTGQIPDE